MSRLLVLAGLFVVAASAPADDGKKAPPDATADLLAKLRQPLVMPAAEDMEIAEFAAAVEKATGFGVVFHRDALPEGVGLKPVRFKGATAATVLRRTLGPHGATFLVRRDHVEIVSNEHARREARQAEPEDARTGQSFLPHPLVSAVVKERPLNEVLAEIAADYDLTVVLAPQAGDHKATFVTARLLNVPADRAIDLLALQADLRVIRRGASFLVTSKDQSDGLFNERLDRERQKIEVENLRNPPGAFIGQPPGGQICGFAGNLGQIGGPGGNIGFTGVPRGGFGGGVVGLSGTGAPGGGAPPR